jgi:hypothetical protein
MTTSENKSKNWQDWLAEFKHAISADGWSEFMTAMDLDETQFQQWAVIYMIPVQARLCNTLLLACLQTTPADVEGTLHSILQVARELRFGKPPRNSKRKFKEFYNESTRYIARTLPSTADMFASVFTHYIHGDYDTQNDINLLMREALTQSVARNRDAALANIGKAGAAALRGCELWDGWASEGPDEFRHWCLSLTTMLEGIDTVLPLGDIAAERKRSAERVAALSAPFHPDKADEDAVADLFGDEQVEKLTSGFTEILNHDNPLSDEEIQQLGKRYNQFGQMAVRSLEMVGTMPDLDDTDDVLSMAVEALGLLRYANQDAIHNLVDIIVHQDDDEYDEELIGSTIWALQQMGSAVIKPALDFAHYSSLEKPRADMLQVLAVVGRGSEEIFNYLAGQFSETPWANNKTRYANPLALTHDPRAVPIIIEALRNPAVTENDAWALLDALQELEVTFYINSDNHSVDIPSHGVIEDVLPAGWRSRQELEEEAAAEDEWDEEWDDEEDEDEDDEDDEEDYDEVIYDKEGIPRCPDCGAEMHYIAGRWVHPPPSIKAK